MTEGKWQKYDCAAVDTYSSSLHGLQAESDSKLDNCVWNNKRTIY